MVDAKISSSTRNPKLTSKRIARYVSSRTSSASSSFNIARPPVVLDFGSSAIRVGYAEQFKPQHIVRYRSPENTCMSESEWYLYLSPVISEIFDRLMIKPSSRRFVVAHPTHPPRTWELAVMQHLWNRGVPAISMVTSLEMIPVAQGWKRGLVVEVSRDEAVCVAHVDGHILPFTFQRVPCGYEQGITKSGEIEAAWTSTMDELWLNENNPSSLVVAILKCLETCPIDVRRYVVGNIVFSGEGAMLVPDIGRRVGRKLKEILSSNQGSESQEAPADEAESPDAGQESLTEPELLTVVPIRKSSLRSLAEHLSITSCAPYRSDLIAWTGTSLWASVWYKYDDDETRIKWALSSIES